MRSKYIGKLHFLVALSIALSASLMSFEYHVPEHNYVIEDPFWVPPIEEDTMIIVKYEEIPELKKPKAGNPEPSPEPEPVPMPESDPYIDLSFVDSINWFDEEPSTGEVDPVFIPTLSFASEMPKACDCLDSDPDCTEAFMMRHFARNLRYPQRPKNMGIDGIVFVEFIINENGQVSNVKAKNKIHPDLEKEATRVVSSLGCFTPGKQGDKNVRVIYTAPIKFNLRP